MIITFDTLNKSSSVGSDVDSLSLQSSEDASKKLRSRRGCMTCKARKKKCDELRPICSTCTRLQKTCVWIDPNCMSKEEIFYIKESVQERERNHKLRNRRSRVTKGALSEIQNQDLWYNSMLPSQTGVTVDVANHTDFHPSTCQPPEVSSRDDGSLLSDQLTIECPTPHTAKIQVFADAGSASNGLDQVLQPIANVHSLSVVTHKSSPNLQQVLLSPQYSAFFDTFDKSVVDWPAVSGSPLLGIFGSLNYCHTGMDDSTNHDHEALSPIPLPPPQPSLLPQLHNPAWQYLYQFYVTSLSDRISILPTSKNSTNWFRSIFLPLASEDLGVLYSILAWLAFSLGESWTDQGLELVGLALGQVKILLEESLVPNPLAKHVPKLALSKLASFIILSSAKICHGDVKEWLIYMKWAARIINTHGGICKFLLSREEMWLVSNFAYHEFMLTGAASSKGALFPEEDYACVLRAQPGVCNGQMNPLLGVSKEMYVIIGKVNRLISSSRGQPDPKQDLPGPSIAIQEIVIQCQHLEKEITDAKPDAEHLSHMTFSEQWQHTSLFRVFQLSTRMHLMQSILKCNPAMLQMQLLSQELMVCLESLLGTPVQPLLVFPVFICAINCCDAEQRMAMRALINRYIALYAPWNVRNVLYVVEKIWELNAWGDRFINWHQILDDMDWELNFA